MMDHGPCELVLCSLNEQLDWQLTARLTRLMNFLGGFPLKPRLTASSCDVSVAKPRSEQKRYTTWENTLMNLGEHGWIKSITNSFWGTALYLFSSDLLKTIHQPAETRKFSDTNAGTDVLWKKMIGVKLWPRCLVLSSALLLDSRVLFPNHRYTTTKQLSS